MYAGVMAQDQRPLVNYQIGSIHQLESCVPLSQCVPFRQVVFREQFPLLIAASAVQNLEPGVELAQPLGAVVPGHAAPGLREYHRAFNFARGPLQGALPPVCVASAPTREVWGAQACLYLL